MIWSNVLSPCGQCPTPPKKASGGRWADYGMTGRRLTCWPDHGQACDWEEEAELNPGETYRRWRVIHPEYSAELPNIEADGETWVPDSFAGSQWACGGGMKGNPPNRVWYQLNYRRRCAKGGNTGDYRAGFAVVEVTDNSFGVMQSDPFNRKFELVDAWLLGPDDKWDDPTRLCHHMTGAEDTSRRTCVSPNYFVLETRERGGTNTIERWGIGDTAPTIYTWANPEASSSPQDNALTIVCKHSCEMGLSMYSEVTGTDGNGDATSIRWYYRLGEVDWAAKGIVESDRESMVARNNVGLTVTRSGADAPAISLGAYPQRIIDLATQLSYYKGQDVGQPGSPLIVYPFQAPLVFDGPPVDPPDMEYGWKFIASLRSYAQINRAFESGQTKIYTTQAITRSATEANAPSFVQVVAGDDQESTGVPWPLVNNSDPAPFRVDTVGINTNTRTTWYRGWIDDSLLAGGAGTGPMGRAGPRFLSGQLSEPGTRIMAAGLPMHVMYVDGDPPQYEFGIADHPAGISDEEAILPPGTANLVAGSPGGIGYAGRPYGNTPVTADPDIPEPNPWQDSAYPKAKSRLRSFCFWVASQGPLTTDAFTVFPHYTTCGSVQNGGLMPGIRPLARWIDENGVYHLTNRVDRHRVASAA